MQYMRRALAVAAVLGGMTSTAVAQTCNTSARSILLVLDASGSMNAKLPNGQSRLAVAQHAIKGVVGLLPVDAPVSLRMYGAQSPANRKDCQDTQQAVAFGPAKEQRALISTAVDAVRAQGYTPIAYTLAQALADFPDHAKERTIVLVSDGKETCQGDPVVAAKALAAKGITVHTVGFIVDTAARGQLQAIARVTGGSYFDAPVGPELPETLKAALNACKKPVVATPAAPKPGKLRTTSATWLSSHPVLNAETGREMGKLDSSHLEIALPAGIYEVRFGAASWKGIEVRPGETTTIEPGVLKVDVSVSAEVIDTETRERHGRLDRVSTSVTLIPGLYDLRFAKTAWRFIKVDGGKVTTLRPVTVRLAEGLKWERARVTTKQGTEVARFDAVTHTVTLPPDDYVIEVDGTSTAFPAAEGAVFEVKPKP